MLIKKGKEEYLLGLRMKTSMTFGVIIKNSFEIFVSFCVPFSIFYCCFAVSLQYDLSLIISLMKLETVHQ